MPKQSRQDVTDIDHRRRISQRSGPIGATNYGADSSGMTGRQKRGGMEDIPCGRTAQLLLLLLQLRALQLLPLLLLSRQVVGGSAEDLNACCGSYARNNTHQRGTVQAVLTDIWPMRQAS